MDGSSGPALPGAGVAWALASLLQTGAGAGGGGARVPLAQWLVIGALALVAVYLLTAAVRCALRLVGLAVLVLGAWLAWQWLA